TGSAPRAARRRSRWPSGRTRTTGAPTAGRLQAVSSSANATAIAAPTHLAPTAQQHRLSPRRDIPASAPGPVVALSVAAILRREQAVEIRVLHPGAWRPGKVAGEEALDSVHAGAKGMLEQPRTHTDPAHASLTQGMQRGHSGNGHHVERHRHRPRNLDDVFDIDHARHEAAV